MTAFHATVGFLFLLSGAGCASGSGEVADAAADAGECDWPLTRKVCAAPCEVVERVAYVCPASEGCASLVTCWVEVATGDLYASSCAMQLRGVDGVYEACSEAQSAELLAAYSGHADASMP